jgi:hypothetical protein
MIVYSTDVLHQVNNEATFSVGLEVNHITESPISKSWAINWYVVFPAPVVNALLVLDLLTYSCDDFSWTENGSLFLLLFVHLLNEWQEPGLKQRVVMVWNQSVSDSVDSLFPQLLAWEGEVSNVGWGHSFHDVFLDTSASGDDAINHFVLAQVPDVLSHSTGGHV